jgi:hypothetical protein
MLINKSRVYFFIATAVCLSPHGKIYFLQATPYKDWPERDAFLERKKAEDKIFFNLER